MFPLALKTTIDFFVKRVADCIFNHVAHVVVAHEYNRRGKILMAQPLRVWAINGRL
jgi:hypothetical protein